MQCIEESWLIWVGAGQELMVWANTQWIQRSSPTAWCPKKSKFLPHPAVVAALSLLFGTPIFWSRASNTWTRSPCGQLKHPCATCCSHFPATWNAEDAPSHSASHLSFSDQQKKRRAAPKQNEPFCTNRCKIFGHAQCFHWLLQFSSSLPFWRW